MSSSAPENDKESPTTLFDPVTPEISLSAAQPVDIPFQAYGFIRAEFLSRLPQDEICYLDSQSCFRLPVRESWNRLTHAYFRHINPLLPVLDETAFWDESRGDGCSGTLSLFVAQAILFAACPFADQWAIKGCGFANCREARAAFYRRAKLLYRLESERCPISIIKGSLLLSLCSSPQIENPVNSLWLSIAVQHLRSMGAHFLRPQEGTTPSFDWLQLKRLWWVCLVRDRLIALGYRRPLQISDENLEAELAVISSEEVSNKLSQSEVHPSPVRQALLFVFLAFCRLCIPLTRTLKLIVTQELKDRSSALKEADECAASLEFWLKSTNNQLERLDWELRGNDMIILHYHLVQIYFHAAYVQILNFRVMILNIALPEKNNTYRSSLLQTGGAIQTSVEAIADSLYTLEQQGLVAYLPIAAVMCIVLPFVLHSMRVKLLPASKETPASRKRTESFLQLIRALQVRQNNVNPVTNVIEQVLTSIQPRKPMADWKQLISTQPDCYLKVLKTLDLALSTGRFPCNTTPLMISGADQLDGSNSIEDFSRAGSEGQAEAFQPSEGIKANAEIPLGALYDDHGGIIQSRLLSEEDFLALGTDADMSGVQSGDPILRDVLGLCIDQDFEALFNLI
ncbi:fungal-specific transcription factor domain-containing protein [Aspergillus terricola var. indicus]